MRDLIERFARMRVPFFGHDDFYFPGSGVVGEAPVFWAMKKE